MGRIAVMMSNNEVGGPMSSHFGKAPWVMLVNAPGAVPEFVRNEAANGGGAAGVVIGRGCTDVLLVDIGEGALTRLQAAGVTVWAVPVPLAGSDALALFSEGKLPRVPAVASTSSRGQHRGCCCGGGGQGHGHDHAHEHGASCCCG